MKRSVPSTLAKRDAMVCSSVSTALTNDLNDYCYGSDKARCRDIPRNIELAEDVGREKGNDP